MKELNEPAEAVTQSLTLSDIIRWIQENSDDESAMDAVNRLSYSFTSKFKNRWNDGKSSS
mgnify:CR=1 FL=1